MAGTRRLRRHHRGGLRGAPGHGLCLGGRTAGRQRTVGARRRTRRLCRRGTSPQLSVGPESTTALMTAVAIAPLAAGDSERYVALAAALALIVAVLSVVAWIARLGFLADLLSKPVLVGYMAGVAVLMIVGQLDNLTGVPVDGDSVASQLRSFVEHAGDVDGATVALACGGADVLAGRKATVPASPATADRGCRRGRVRGRVLVGRRRRRGRRHDPCRCCPFRGSPTCRPAM